MHKLSVVIITFNEAKNIARCLQAASLVADEMIVYDSFSTDDTCKITHKLSGEFVESNTEPYIYNNKLKAFQELFTKLSINQKFLMDFVNQPDIPNFKYAL